MAQTGRLALAAHTRIGSVTVLGDAAVALGLAFGGVCALLEGTDVCFAPVLSPAEALSHPHNRARGLYQANATGGIDALAAPRFQALSGST